MTEPQLQYMLAVSLASLQQVRNKTWQLPVAGKVWNSLPKGVDFSSLLRFKRSIQRVDFSSFTKCF